MVLSRRVQRRFVIAGLAGLLAAPAFMIQPASAAIAFTCDSVTGSAVFSPGLAHDKRLQGFSSGPTALTGPQEVTLASTNDAGVKANRGSLGAALSADGRFVAFGTDSTNLDPRATETFISDVYVKDLDTGDLTLVSTTAAGVKGNRNSWEPALSADGTRVAFWSDANNLDPADTDTLKDIYVKDLTTGELMLASTSDTGVKGNGPAAYAQPYLWGDGTKVVFSSTATNLDPADTDTVSDVYVKDLDTGDIELVSTNDTGVKGNGSSSGGRLSVDGQFVVFTSQSTNLDPADTDTLDDAYVKDLDTGDIRLVSTTSTGVKGNDDTDSGFLSADNTKVSLTSRSTNLDPADHDGRVADAYVKNLVTGELTLVSTSDAGVKGQNNSGAGSFNADGTKVIVASNADNLDLSDDTSWDVFIKDLTTGDLTLVSSSDTGVGGNDYNASASPSADFSKIAFVSLSNNFDPVDPPSDFDYDIYVKEPPSTPTSIAISGCSNGNSGTASIVDIRSYDPRPLGCPVSLGGAAGNDYADTTPILVGANPTFTIDWASGPNSYGVAAAKAGPTSTQWRFRLAITASPDHDTPATNQYLPAAGSGFTKTRLQGKFDVSALDSFNCTTGTADPLSWLSLANNGTWVAKTS